MKPSIPENMTVVGLSEDGRLVSHIRPVPKPGPGEVLVRIAAAPVNPSDLARIRQVTGTAGQDSFVSGIEGSGTVVAHGTGFLPRLWMGKRVACSYTHQGSGTWADYMVTAASHCIPLPAGISDEQGAMLLINPLTAVAFIDIARQGKHRAIVNTAAASSLGRMIEFLARQKRIPVINIVRNARQQQDLLAGGSVYVLNSAEEHFSESLQELSHKLQASLVLDAVGGKHTQELILAIPYDSSLVIYGNLSGEQPEIDHRSLVMENKKVSGFFLGNWLNEGSPVNMLRSSVRVRKLLKSEITIPVQGRFPLQEAQLAVDRYLENMTAGKVLLIPDLRKTAIIGWEATRTDIHR